MPLFSVLAVVGWNAIVECSSVYGFEMPLFSVLAVVGWNAFVQCSSVRRLECRSLVF